MTTVTEVVDVEVPLTTAYNQWTQFESFPRFMSGVQSVRQIDDRHTHWVTNVGGVQREFDAEIVEQHADRHIAWNSVDGDLRQSGAVTFEPMGPSRTRVTIRLDWEPEGLVEKVGGALGAGDRQVKADAHRFKEFIEQRGTETGAWRGDLPRTDGF